LEELRRIRGEAGLSQSQLARESGVDRATINKIEQGKRSPSIATLESLARALGVEIADFFPKVQSPLPLEATAVWAPLFEEVLDAARQDVKRGRQTRNRAESSQGVPQGMATFAEDAVRTKWRNLGFPDELWEPLVWPLAERLIGAENQVVELEQKLEAKERESEKSTREATRT
jgi:transcriptional regulator with XRE-family HTH domain